MGMEDSPSISCGLLDSQDWSCSEEDWRQMRWKKGFHALTSSKEEAQRLSFRFLASLEQGLCQAPTKCTNRQYATTNAQPYTRMVLPFNVWFHNSPFFRSLRRVYDRWNHRFGQQGRCVRVGLAWRLGGTHLIHLLRRAALKPCLSDQWQAFV